MSNYSLLPLGAEKTNFTIHSCDRLSERVGIHSENPDDITAFVNRVWKNGHTIDSYNAKQKRYLVNIVEKKDPEEYTLRIHSGFCYIFTNMGTLITVYALGNPFQRLGRRKGFGSRDVSDDDPGAFFSDLLKKHLTFPFLYVRILTHQNSHDLFLTVIFQIKQRKVIIMMHDAGKPLHEKTKVFLKHQLKQHGLTREEFAEQFHCDERTVRRWESKGVNSLTTVGQLIEFFHASIRDVFPVGEDVPDLFLYAGQKLSFSFWQFCAIIRTQVDCSYERKYYASLFCQIRLH